MSATSSPNGSHLEVNSPPLVELMPNTTHTPLHYNSNTTGAAHLQPTPARSPFLLAAPPTTAVPRHVTTTTDNDVYPHAPPVATTAITAQGMPREGPTTQVNVAQSSAPIGHRLQALLAPPEAPLPDAGSRHFQEKINVSVTRRTKGLYAFPEIPESVTDELAAMDNYYVSISDPTNSTVRMGERSSLFWWPYKITRLLAVQVVLFVLYLICLVMVLVRAFGGSGGTSWFTSFVMLVYVLEMIALLAFQRTDRLSLPSRYYWRFIEPLCVVLAYSLELVAWIRWAKAPHVHGDKQRPSAYWFWCWMSLFLWAAHGGTRWEQLHFGIRCLCSADRRRYQAEGYDLDYAYIHRNIAAMAWPAYNYERLFRNAIEDTAGFLDRKHPNSYLVVNLCSERTYAPDYFHCQTTWYPMDDHNPAELEMMVAFCREASDFIQEDPHSRVIAVHCKGGKGRTGTLIAAYLMFTGLKRSATAALRHFAHLRTHPGAASFQGVQAPSQERYVRYFERLLGNKLLQIPQRAVRITSLRIYNAPWAWVWHDLGKLWFVVMQKPCTERTVAFLSNPQVTFDPRVPDPAQYTAKQLRDLFGSDEDNLYKSSQMEDGAEKRDAGYALDKTSFWYYVNHSSARLGYDEMTAAVAAFQGPTSELRVDLELKDPSRIPVLRGDVVVKFFFCRNNPNPLEPPVQFWFHAGFEEDGVMQLSRNMIDGPPKDKKMKRYPIDFAIHVGLQSA